MDRFVMEIAGLVVEIQPMFESTREYCKSYLSAKAPEFFVQTRAEDLLFQQELLYREAEEEDLKKRKFTEAFLERATIQRRVADALLSRDTLMFHGSTVAVDGKAYLFTAPCGTGKSTHTRLWREYFGDRAVMVNDDMPFLRVTEDGVYACGSPWCGKHGLGTNICVPLRGICLLRRGGKNVISPAKWDAVRTFLSHQVHAPDDRAFALLDKLAARVPLWEMVCNKESEAAQVAYKAMNGGK